MEGWGVSCIHFIGAEYTSWRNHADGQSACLHDSGLYRGGLGAEHDILIDIEGILFILCRMVWRNV